LNFGYHSSRVIPRAAAFQPAERSPIPLILWLEDSSLRLKSGSARDDANSEKLWIFN
jgi:hypothetical protein